jgi:hypothetical protein
MKHGFAFCIVCLLEDRIIAIVCFLFPCSQLTSRVITISLLYTLHCLFCVCRTFPVPCQSERTLIPQHTIESALVPDEVLPYCSSTLPE